MSTKLEKLMFHIGLVDKASGGVNKVTASIDRMQQQTRKAVGNIVAGGAGLAGVGFAMQRMVAPSIEMSKALGEVRSLGVNEKALKQLSQTALKHSMQYGTSAAEFVGASYDIQSAISGLTGNELSSFTQASAVLAKATKSDVATATNYTGTMYGIFQKHATNMGKAQWVEMLAGQTASAVKMFKTTGSEMSAAFTSVGAGATSAGISMNEQMAILGALQATMSGSEAGTKYSSFLAGVGKAQDSLGLKFTDAQGQLLPMVDILRTLKGKFGDTFDVAESDALKKAFGSKEAVGMIKLLMADTDGLAKNISNLGKVKGMDDAIKMAKANTNIWDRVGSSVQAVSIVFGQALQPALDPLLEIIGSISAKIVRWTNMFPVLTKYVGVAVVGIMGLVAATSLMSIAGGVLSLAFSPVVLIIGAVAALAAGVYYLYKNWDKVSESFGNTFAFQLIRFSVLATVEAFSFFADAIGIIVDGWTLLFDVISNSGVGDFIGSLVDDLLGFKDTLTGILKSISDNGLLNSVFGLISGVDTPEQKPLPTLNSTSLNPNEKNIQGGGLLQSISNSMKNNNSRSVVVEKIEMNGSDKDGYDIMDQLKIAVG